MKNLQCSVIVPVWNKSRLTDSFLSQHMMFTTLFNTTHELIIVDNGSTDDTQAVLEKWKDRNLFQFRVIRSLENLGFGGGNNLGVSKSNGDVLIFTQNDIRITGNYIDTLYNFAMERKQSLCGPSLYKFDTGWNNFQGEVVPYVEGWCLACYRETWLEIGGFDESYYPCDFEDVDLSQAFLRAGKTLESVNVPLSHIGHGTAGVSQAREAITKRHREKFAGKWGYNL